MKINFLGDIYLTNKVDIATDIVLDNVILNIEAPFTDIGTPKHKKVNLYMNPKYLFDTFVDKKILAVNLSNNHILDYGIEGLDYTIKILKDNNIPYYGVGEAVNNYNNPVIIDKKIALFGYTCRSTNGVYGDKGQTGAAPFDIEKVIEEIQKYRNKYFITLSIHWGTEHYSFPKPCDVEKARKLIDSGADLIIGNHPHKLQSKEKYKGKNIYYSLGNGIFHDVDLKSYYNGSEFVKNFKWKFKKKSRISSKVCLNTENLDVENVFLYQNKDNLTTYKSKLLNFKNEIILGRKVFLFYDYLMKKKLYFTYYINDPKMIINNLRKKFFKR